jgi:N-acetyl-beta-hexosaminidase
MPRGIANRVPMNLTVSLPQSGALVGTADTDWVYDHDNAGKQCVRHAETGLSWTRRPSGVATAEADGEGNNFYSLRGVIDSTGKHFDGNLTHAGSRGTFHLSLDAPQIASACHAKPVPPPPPPLPPPPLPLKTNPSTVWPLPQREARGSDAVELNAQQFELTAAPGSTSPALEAAFNRYRTIFFPHHTASEAPTARLLTSLTVHIMQVSTPLTLGVDESYNLTIDRTAGAAIHANTLFGAYHGLESIAQLIEFDFDSVSYKIRGVPLVIEDRPRFAWRELMVDTSRHFLPVSVLKTVVDSMLTTKLNVLHLHLVDSQAFPLVLPSAPRLSKGAYSSQEQYEDLQSWFYY